MQDQGHDENWEPCPPGMLQDVARTSSNSNSLAVIGGSVVMGLAVMAVIISMMMTPERNVERIPVISCEEVQLQLASFVQSEISDCKLNYKITQHIMKCEHCRNGYHSHCQISCDANLRPAKAVMKPCPAKTP